MSLRTIFNSTIINTLDLLMPYDSDMLDNGVREFGAIEDCSKVSSHVKKKFDQLYKESPKPQYVLTDLEEYDFKDIFTDKQFVDAYKAALAYVGYGAKLDFAALFRTYNTDAISSGLAHHDSVGRRVKLYVVLGDNSRKMGEKPPRTMVVKDTSSLRLSYENSKVVDGKRVNLPKNAQAAEITSRQGSVYAFDTNLLHWGDYQGRETIYRDTLQLEFSNVIKGHLIKGDIGYRTHNLGKDNERMLQSIQ